MNDAGENVNADVRRGVLPSRIFSHLAEHAYLTAYSDGAKAYFALANALSRAMTSEDTDMAIAHYHRLCHEYDGKDLTIGL